MEYVLIATSFVFKEILVLSLWMGFRIFFIVPIMIALISFIPLFLFFKNKLLSVILAVSIGLIGGGIFAAVILWTWSNFE